MMSLTYSILSRARRVAKPERYHAHASHLSTTEFVDLAYALILGRKADPYGLRHHTGRIESGETSRNHLIHELTESPEYRAISPEHRRLDDHDFVAFAHQVLLGRRASFEEVEREALLLQQGKTTRAHLARTLCSSEEFLRHSWTGLDFWLTLRQVRRVVACQLPRARRILHLGESKPQGSQPALVAEGYPYSFDHLHVPIRDGAPEVLATPRGTVEYHAGDWSQREIGEDTIDMAYVSGAFERVVPQDAARLLERIRLALRDGGELCFETPNREVTRLGFPELVAESHRHEYTRREMQGLLIQHGFEITEAKGLTLMDQSVREGRFIPEESLGRDRFYADIENCFFLYFKARKV